MYVWYVLAGTFNITISAMVCVAKPIKVYNMKIGDLNLYNMWLPAGPFPLGYATVLDHA